METAVSVENKNKIYSGGLKPGWDSEAGYDRLRFVDLEQTQSLSSIGEIVEKGLTDLPDKELSRLDLRLVIDESFPISELQSRFPAADVSVRPNLKTGDFFLTMGINNEGRELAAAEFLRVQKFVAEKIEKNREKIVDFESHAREELQKLSEHELYFETDMKNFSASEIYNLWGPMFDWSHAGVSGLLEKPKGDMVYGLRNNQGELVACALVSGGESTEWAVCPSQQGRGIITPLLLHVHADQIKKNGSDVDLYAHLRFNRSISPGMKSGMELDSPLGNPNILTNHVDVDGELTHFVEGKVDTSLFTPEVLQLILNK